MVKINFLFIPNNDSILQKNIENVKKLILQHAKKAAAVLPFKISNLTFTVYSWKKNGVSGFTQANDWIQIRVNYAQLLSKTKHGEKLIEQLIYIIYHEMHHACRGYAGYLPKNKEHILINSMISEGLADHFAAEQHPSRHILKTKSYDIAEINSWIKKIGKIMWNKESLDDSWLYGGKGKPKMLGYKIGRYIIQEIKEKNPKLNSVALTNASAERILKLSGVDF